MVDYTTVTELPGNKASREQIARLYQRYHFACQFCKEKDVLEVACGAGQGLGYLAKAAKKVVGSDIDKENLEFAQRQYKGRNNIRLEHFDAQKIPFENDRYDVVILYEAIYYLENPGRFIDEAYRILKNNGLLIICTANKDWADFNPSSYSVKYFSVPELSSLIKRKFKQVDFCGGFSTEGNGLKDSIVSFIKRTAVNLHLMPKTMRGKELFKRLFFGKLYSLPAEIEDGVVEYIKPVPISLDLPNSSYKVIFVVGYKDKDDAG